MTNETLTIIIAAVAPTIAACGAVIIGILNAKKSDQIHVLVNSNMSAVKADLVDAREKIDVLRAAIEHIAFSPTPISMQAALAASEKAALPTAPAKPTVNP